ncbi:MAG: TetR/AcrR family transcriptional regulator [Paracoccaceae bacterium]|nr:TetR/AcrR family transcriptional regulator [Paracoccaceae bacterium]
MNVLTQRVKKGRKFEQVLRGAREVFMADGFEGASVDTIARAAGVSKATLYAYFPDKRLLFMEVAKCECIRQADEAIEFIDLTAPPRVVLAEAASRILGFYLTDFGIRVFRIFVAESDRFPELGREFYESGPALVRARMADYFRDAVGRGELRIEDIQLAADQFAELCKADIFPRLIFGVRSAFSEAEKRRVIDGAVETFMARYGVT